MVMVVANIKHVTFNLEPEQAKICARDPHPVYLIQLFISSNL